MALIFRGDASYTFSASPSKLHCSDTVSASWFSTLSDGCSPRKRKHSIAADQHVDERIAFKRRQLVSRIGSVPAVRPTAIKVSKLFLPVTCRFGPGGFVNQLKVSGRWTIFSAPQMLTRPGDDDLVGPRKRAEHDYDDHKQRTGF